MALCRLFHSCAIEYTFIMSCPLISLYYKYWLFPPGMMKTHFNTYILHACTCQAHSTSLVVCSQVNIYHHLTCRALQRSYVYCHKHRWQRTETHILFATSYHLFMTEHFTSPIIYCDQVWSIFKLLQRSYAYCHTTLEIKVHGCMP